MRGSRAIAVGLGTGAFLLVSVALAATLLGHASADVYARSDDEPIRTAPENFADLTVQAVPAASPAPAAKAETAARPTATSPLPIEVAETGARVMSEWAGPRLAQAQQAAARYEPDLEVKVARTSDGAARTRVSLALGRSGADDLPDRVAAKVGFHQNSRAAFGNRGRWYLFTATSNDAVGFNMLQGMHGELHRAGFSQERVAAIGDRQSGLAWRKGQMQASLAYVQRELSTFGASVEERFVALTISFKGWGRPPKAPPRRTSQWAPYQPQWPPQEPDPHYRR